MTRTTRTRASRLTCHAAALVLALAALPGSLARADDIEFTRPPSRGELEDLTRELGVSAFGAKFAAAESLGPARFDIQFGGTGTQISEDEDFWVDASDGDTPSGTLAAGRASLRVGLPLHLDVGIFAQRLSSGSAESDGAEVKWEFIHGDNAMPAFAARVMYARLRNVDELSADAVGADVSISKGFGFFTPYGGIGRMWLDSEVSDVEGFSDVDVSASPGVNQAFLGARLSFGWFRIHVEAQWAADTVSYGATAGFKFP